MTETARPSRDLADGGIILQRADALYTWLLARPSGALPRSAAILRALPELGSVERVSEVFRLLARQGRIEQRHGTLRSAYGHRIVRIVASGAVLQTDGCTLTFVAPEACCSLGVQRTRCSHDEAANRDKHRIGNDTLRRVLRVVEDCADRQQRLPRPPGLGKRVGRSAETARRALSALHDDGLLILRQRGTRRAAELPDGRSTL